MIDGLIFSRKLTFSCCRKGTESLKHRTKTTAARRTSTHPYQNVDLPFGEMSQLSLAKEPCKKDSCSCNKFVESNAPFQLPKACINESNADVRTTKRKILRDAKLKVHNNQKDQNGVLRKMHVFNSKDNPHWKSSLTLAKGSPTLLKEGTVKRDTVFGEAHKSSDFGKLASTVDISEKSADVYPARKFSPSVSVPGKSSACFVPGLSEENSDSVSAVVTSRSKCSVEAHNSLPCTCAQEARIDGDSSIEELAGYFEHFVHIPKKMSSMAEMMYM